MTSIMWFRRDLRLADNPALAAALAAGDVVPLFVIDPAFARAGTARQALLRACLRGLADATLGALVTRVGDPRTVVSAVADEVDADAVYVAKDFSPYGRSRDAAVGERLQTAGRALRGVGSPYAVEPGRVVKDDGTPYAVFTPYSRRWRAHGWADPLDAPVDPDWVTLPADPLPPIGEPPVAVPAATEAAVWARWEAFVDSSLDSYGERRDLPAVDGTSWMSPFLKFGVVHPRQLLADIDERNDSHLTYAKELAWRDFYADILFQRPHTAWENLDTRFDRLDLDTGDDAAEKFRRWCEGNTGFPIVDAGMRQLVSTGWMHNRVRMIVASFLVKDLHLPWQWGARFFLRHLLDGDLASNNHGWQWAAGTGTDASPFFRVFNPTAQQQRWDPDGAYVERWVPEVGTEAYPEPMVDHAAERREALARYQAIKTS